MTPFRVRIRLQTPIVEPSQPFHLDALLSALRVQAAERQSETVDPRSVQHDLPLARYVSPGGEWCFKASAFKLHRESEAFPWMMTGRSDLEQAAEDRQAGLLKLRAGAPNTAGGPFKSSRFAVSLVWAWLEAWGVGDVGAVRALLADCRQVGGRRGTAFGKVASIEVRDILEPDCRWYWRALPIDCGDLPGQEERVPTVGHLRAPYWDRREHREVLVPMDL